ncbi:hypothetical protein [Mycobacterium sp. SP-6446]|uniref:hypothetical protein n=1 Tax=Mycobacterium sp. SP-6446 TaxID=1834162 RepID=UPI00096EF623|nr:hypothetical protein [Mycobacterium sp. SP-6446]OMC17688.1 hypothetical protein A5736_15745 [Mycobacterium sp. SP-6446]
MDLFFQFLLVFWRSEHLSDIKAVSLRELTGGLPRGLLVQDPLHRIEDIAAIFRCSKTSQRTILVYCGHNLRHLRCRRLFGVLDLFDPLITLVSQIGQIVLEALHAVVGVAVRALLGAVLFSNPPRLTLTLLESVAEIIGRIALLFGERTGLRIAKHVCEMHKPNFDLSAIHLPV